MASPNVEVANDFFHDSLDFLRRYRLTVEAFYAIRSRRLKLFLDLRMAAECALKALIAYHLPQETSRGEAIKKVEGYSHKMTKLAADTKAHVETDKWAAIDAFIDQLDALPIGLRYQLDGNDFRELNEDFYYATVGSDDWLDQLHDAVKVVADSLDSKLQSHSRIISGDELFEELMKSTHNKYIKKAKT